MTVLHYHNSFSAESVHEMLSDFGKSNTDQSGVRPDVSSARAVISTFTGNNGLVGKYDFSDGKDTGDRLMTFLRSKSLDITEVDGALQYAMRNAESLRKADIDKFIKDNEDSDSKTLRQALKDFFVKSPKKTESSKESTE